MQVIPADQLEFEIEKIRSVRRQSEKDFSNSLISNSRHRYKSSCGKFIYHIAIIDYLQTFNFDKWMESRFKIYVLRRSEALISAVDPELYGDRFLSFMKSELLLDSILENWQKSLIGLNNK